MMPLFKKVLIANRGEIAIRVIRACREMGISTVAVYSEGDANSLHVRFADEAICIGPAAAGKSYLNVPAIISAAEVTGAEAIHPGYGFMAENADFSEICSANNIVFIGASPENIRLMGNKSMAKDTMKKNKVPCVPGSDGVVKNEKELEEVVKQTGYPIMIKASSGGGGKGMRMVKNESELKSSFRNAVAEATAAFGDGDVYVEKLIEKPRHVEIQILSDKHKHAIHLGERDCSIQRRHQKLLEECPSPVVNDELREKMGLAAIRAAQAISYQGAGTVEFLLDKNGDFYFMEMNTRIQVEHTITEMITNLDIVKQQIKIAATGKLELQQSDVVFNGHSIEFRINAENPMNDFSPSPGVIDLFLPPGGFGVRTDSHVYPTYRVPPHYDSLLGKLIVWGRDRNEAIARGLRALDEFVIDGVDTTIPFHKWVLKHPKFIEGDVTTHFLEENYESFKQSIKNNG